MEKNTKILLGIGAAIAAYLILKPKKDVVAQTIVNKEPSKINLLELKNILNKNNNTLIIVILEVN